MNIRCFASFVSQQDVVSLTHIRPERDLRFELYDIFDLRHLVFTCTRTKTNKKNDDDETQSVKTHTKNKSHKKKQNHHVLENGGLYRVHVHSLGAAEHRVSSCVVQRVRSSLVCAPKQLLSWL